MNINDYLENDKEEVGLFEEMLDCPLDKIEEKRAMIKAIREVKLMVKRILNNEKV